MLCKGEEGDSLINLILVVMSLLNKILPTKNGRRKVSAAPRSGVT